MVISGTFIPASRGQHIARTPAGIEIRDEDAAYYNKGIKWDDDWASDFFGYEVVNPKLPEDEPTVIIICECAISREKPYNRDVEAVFLRNVEQYNIISDCIEFRDTDSNAEIDMTEVKNRLQINDAELKDVIKYAEIYASNMLEKRLRLSIFVDEDWFFDPRF